MAPTCEINNGRRGLTVGGGPVGQSPLFGPFGDAVKRWGARSVAVTRAVAEGLSYVPVLGPLAAKYLLGEPGVPKAEVFDGERLGAWVQAVRLHYRKGALPAGRVHLLSQVRERLVRLTMLRLD